MSRVQPTGHGRRETIPASVKDFIDFLDRRYPELSPRPGQTLEEVMFAAGQRSVAQQMRAEFEAASNLPED
ncbi:hypothetical protein E4M02_04250 [Brevundimonas sp. S30B]|uniref:hypothetical protein n=2 Tax=unclassified Brevundimonas TaxID=2622653 RepID=UPI0010716F0D|nr:hypothetical protein [Brevundimonas sp. S30B]TFW04289.1 hypothetical protein E4M02_04250 [Brevundimonas sp. S30B]